jgi:hypothetical protein
MSKVRQPAAGYFDLHLSSVATAETLITVARAAAAQYMNRSIELGVELHFSKFDVLA